MIEALSIVLYILLGAVVLVLLAGLVVMFKGGAVNRRWGNKLMRYRVALQALAVLLLGLLFLIRG